MTANSNSSHATDSRIIAVTNNKGGVGKTTSCIFIGAALAEAGLKVLILDLDPQANCSETLTTTTKEERNEAPYKIQDLWTLYKKPEELSAALESLIHPTIQEGLSIAVSNEYLSDALLTYQNDGNAGEYLKRSLIKSDVRSRYDVILIDTPPSLGFGTRAAIKASDGLIVPIKDDMYSMEGLQNIKSLIETESEWDENFPQVRAVYFSEVDAAHNQVRTIEAKKNIENIEFLWPGTICESFIRRDATVKRVQRSQKNPFKSSKADQIRLVQDYTSLAHEIASRFGIDLKARSEATPTETSEPTPAKAKAQDQEDLDAA